MRSAQHNPDCPAEMSEGFETAIQYMDNKYLNEVLKRLESYRKKEQQIELLRYELQRIK